MIPIPEEDSKRIADAKDAERYRFLKWLADEGDITIVINDAAVDKMMIQNQEWK